MVDQTLIKNLEEQARQMRIEIVKMVHQSTSGHPGGSLSAADIVTALYFHEMRIDPKNPCYEDRDRFILSKGHCCPVIYTALALRGYYECSHLGTLRRHHSILQGHPCMNKTPGLDMVSGSLGNGPSLGIGMALGAKLDQKDYRVFVMVGDGEMQEGMIWEALMAGAQFKLDNLYLIVDYNHLQVDGTVEQIMNIAPLKDKLEAFNWQVVEMDGHNMAEIVATLDRVTQPHSGPVAIIAHTVKGKGVSFMENKVEWHGLAPDDAQLEQALAELEGGKTNG